MDSLSKRRVKRALASAERRIRRAVREANARDGHALLCPIVDAAIAARDALIATPPGRAMHRDWVRRMDRAIARTEARALDEAYGYDPAEIE